MNNSSNQNLLRALNVKPNKERGQNFLVEPHVVEQILAFGRPQADESLVEIGPGLGAMTGELLGVAPLTVIEIEDKFCEHLMSEYPNLNIINEDVRFVDFSELGNDLVVFGNLPYSLSSDIIFHLIEFSSNVKRAVLMLQKEFAERIAASPGSKKYGSLSVFVQLKAEPVLGPVFGSECFYPEPKVDSQIFELRIYKESPYQINDPYFFRQIVLKLFSERRKKIANTLKKVPSIEQVDFKAMLSDNNIDPNLRPENLSVQDFVTISNIFKQL